MDLNTTLRRSYDTEMLILRSLFALDPDTNMPISTNYVVTTDGIGGLRWMNPFQNLSSAGVGIGYLPSTINGFRGNISTLSSQVSTLTISVSSLSTAIGNTLITTGVYDYQLVSTVKGLATSRYVSSSQLVSTVKGLGSSDYISSSQLTSTTAWFYDASRYVSSGALISTTAGLIPLLQMKSTVQGLGSAGYVSSLSLQSTVQSISTLIYSTFTSTLLSSLFSTFVTPGQLLSTVSSLGTYGYLSTSQLVSTTNYIFDNSRYVSTGALVSTVSGLSNAVKTTYYIDNGGDFNILGGTVIVSSAASVVFLSTFVLSSITYSGYNGTITPVRYPDATTGNHMFFSTAKLPLDRFSSYILTNSRINLEIYPHFVFPRLNTGATQYSFINMSTMLAYGSNYLAPVANSWVYAGNQTSGFGNPYQSPIQLQIPGSLINNKYVNDYYLVHNLVSSVTSNLADGFVNDNIQVRFGSTNSLFLSIQNLP